MKTCDFRGRLKLAVQSAALVNQERSHRPQRKLKPDCHSESSVVNQSRLVNAAELEIEFHALCTCAGESDVSV